MNASFPRERFEREFWHAKTRADVYVKFSDGAKVAVEVKHNLQDRSEFHRLVGQVYEYVVEWQVEVVVLLTGKSDPELMKCVQMFCSWLHRTERKKVVLTLPQLPELARSAQGA